MNGADYTRCLAQQIAVLRKARGLTQEALAERLSVTFQAVSKWECEQSSPDISLLPHIADIFGVTVDALFGLPERRRADNLPWQDDNTLHAAVFRGHSLLESFDRLSEEITFVYQGEALNVQSGLSIRCGDILGNATAGGGIRCGSERTSANNAIGGNASAGGGINCGSVGGGARAGGGINCGSVQGGVNAGGGINCGSVHGGSVSSGGGINCGSIHTEGGSVEVKSNLSCGDISCGELRVGGNVKCKTIKAAVMDIDGKIFCKRSGGE